ncbi:hypothetical protein ABAC460_02715 [Asticcacaulis sp. AC460]|nr:hypothetical protein ABAC460_02715 [Asticcacaulis sp. AC460]
MAMMFTPESTPDQRVRLASALSVAVAFVLVGLKGFVLIQSSSMAILASLADSGLDLLASLVTFFAVRYARKQPDKEFPFGHGKAEAFSALFQAGLVFASAALVMRACYDSLLHPQPVAQSGLAIGVLVVSILLTLGLVWFQTAALKASGSVAVAADRMHYLGDLATNLIAIAGIAVAALGLPLFDTLAGFAMALLLVWGAVQVLREAADQLMDRSLSDDDVARIKTLAGNDSQILDVHAIRTRQAGPYVAIQMHIVLDAALTLEAAHMLLLEAEKRVLEAFPNADIIIHPDPRGANIPHGGVFAAGPAKGHA